MVKLNKTLAGLAGFLAISLATTGNLIASTDASALAKRVDTLNVYVARNYPSISFSSIKSDTKAAETINAEFSFDHAKNVNFVISSIDSEGNYIEVPAGQLAPKNGSGRQTVSFDLASLGLDYGAYTLTAKSESDLGYAEDAIEFAYAPVDASILSTLEAVASKSVSESKSSNDTSKAFLAASSAIMTAVLVSGIALLKRAEKRTTSKRQSTLPKGSMALSRGVATFM